MLGIGTLAKKVFGTPNDRKINATRPLVDTITALEPEYEKLSDEGLVEKTRSLQQRAQAGETLEALLPEAFANCREAARRALGLRAFDVQLMGGIFLHEGNISEMKTSEGKTLVATLPAFLNTRINNNCLLYSYTSPCDRTRLRMTSSACKKRTTKIQFQVSYQFFLSFHYPFHLQPPRPLVYPKKSD